ncbi:alkaline serine protease, partial [Vibrio agarivorans]
MFMCSSAFSQQGLISDWSNDNLSSAPLILAQSGEEAIKGRYIVVLKSPKNAYNSQIEKKALIKATINDMSNSLEISPQKVFEHSISGFVADLNQSQINILRKDSRVSFI